jgi:YgiT-type zinc finger domain-containing protein
MASPEALRSTHPFDGDSTVAVEQSPMRRSRSRELDGDPTLQLPRSRFQPGPVAFTAGEPGHLAMRCLYCQGRIERGTAPVAVDRDGCRLRLEAVPAWVCTGCAEAYFEGREVELIRRALGAMRDLRPALR